MEHSEPREILRQAVHTPSETALEYFFYATGMGHYAAVPSYYTRRSDYNLLLIACTVGGEGQLDYNGKGYRLKKGDLFIIDCNQEQFYRTVGEVWDFYWVHIGGDAAFKYYNLICEKRGNVFKANPQFLEDWQQLYNVMSNTGFESEPKMSVMLHGMLTSVLTGDQGANAFENVEELIRQRYMEHISLQDMARRHCVSKYHFSRKFKAQTGFSPYEYLIKYRINIAKGLLLETDATVDEIAERCGFESASNFINKFKRTVGVTPGVYRRDRI